MNAFSTGLRSSSFMFLYCPSFPGEQHGMHVGNVPMAFPLAIENLGGVFLFACSFFILRLQSLQTAYLPLATFLDRVDSSIPSKPGTVYSRIRDSLRLIS